MNLLNLAPDIQETILFLPRTDRGRTSIILAELQLIAAVMDWGRQGRMWAVLPLSLPDGLRRLLYRRGRNGESLGWAVPLN